MNRGGTLPPNSQRINGARTPRGVKRKGGKQTTLTTKPKAPDMASRRLDNPTYKANRKQLLAGNPPCYWCGAPASEADHLIEHDRGGTDDLTNLVPACKPCNGRRGAAYKNKAKKKLKKNKQKNHLQFLVKI